MSYSFPLAIISDEVSQDIHRLLAFARDFQLEGIEIRSLFGRAFKDLTKKDVREIGSRLRDAGLKIAACASPVFKCHFDRPSEIMEHVDIFKRRVEKAIAWDCDLVRVFTFLRKNTPSMEDEIKYAADHFQKLIEAVKGTSIRIGVENEYTTVVGNGTELRGFFKWVRSPLVGIVWDPCNVLFMPGTGDPVVEDYPLIADRLIHIHVKDACREVGKPAEHCVELGTGEVDFLKQMVLLKQQDYRGWVSLETHWRTTALSAEAQHLPAGHAFSADAESASRICMKKLIAMLNKL